MALLPPAPLGLRANASRPRLARLAQGVRAWRAKRRSSPLWTATVAVLVAIVVMPVLAVVILALAPSDGTWRHLLSTVLPHAAGQTLLLMGGVGIATLFVGTGAAWLVTLYRFPGRAVIDRLLVMPLAMPTYIVAFCYVELLDYSGPVQSSLRGAFGWTTPSSYWFPDIRSLPGAVVVLSAVLYPYVYLAARASFVQQSVCVLEVARTLGRTPLRAFAEVALPMARPALAAGVALALMESLNDLGAVQHLGVDTLSASIYATWQRRGSLAGAAQIAVVALLLMAVLFAIERWARGGQRSHHTTGRYRSIPFHDIEGWKGYATAALCLLPFIAGFVVPAAVLARSAVTHLGDAFSHGLLFAMLNTLMLSAVGAAAAVAAALVLVYARRVAANGFTRPAVDVAGLGYAIPGTVLAIGLLVPLAAFDNMLDGLMRALFGVSTGLVLSGSLFALTLAYVIRFLAVALGGLDAGLDRISPNLDAASRALGETALSTLRRVHLPLLVPAMGAAGLMVFVDCMKELPATLLLRPFNFDTLAVHVYALATQEQFERAAPGALVIVLAGLIPVLLLHEAVAGGRPGGKFQTRY
ncbi:MAG: ABC transporter permease [Hyphomicrobium sp.]